jgi:MFS-type transporter involved in bile tolerance (Atg22 family)
VYLREELTATYGESLGLRYAVATLALLFAVGLVLLIFAPETNKQELPE